MIGNREEVVKGWFCNLNKKKINDSILMLFNTVDLSSIQRLATIKNQDLMIYHSSRILNYKLLNSKEKNHVLIIDQTNKLIQNLSYINRKILVVPIADDFYQNMENYIYCKDHKEIIISQKEENQFLLYKDDVLNLISAKNLYALIEMKLRLLGEIDTGIYNIIIYGIKIENFPYENLESDIGMLHNYNVLTSRLAIIIYRLATLELDANVTKIGREIHKLTGSKSKTFTPKMIRVKSKDLNNKNFRAYDLNVNDREITIRTEIANNLLSYDIKELTPEIIAIATRLPLKTIQNLDSKFF